MANKICGTDIFFSLRRNKCKWILSLLCLMGFIFVGYVCYVKTLEVVVGENLTRWTGLTGSLSSSSKDTAHHLAGGFVPQASRSFTDEHGRRVDSASAVGRKEGFDKNTTVKSSKFDYFVEVDDDEDNPGTLLKMIVRQSPPELMQLIAARNGLEYDEFRGRWKSQIAWPTDPALSNRTRWALIVHDMRELGYEQRLPVFIGIGVKKSGTSALLLYLIEHPQIARSIHYEVNYFTEHYGKGIEYYRAHMGFSTADQFGFEKSPLYLFQEDVPRNILKDMPNPSHLKFILCVRDPVERLISEFRHSAEEFTYKLRARGGRKAEARSETSLSQAKVFEQTVFDSNGQVNASIECVHNSIYSTPFKNWLESFPRERFYIVNFEQMNKDLYQEMKNIETFLGLKSFYQRDMFTYQEARHVPCMKSVCPPNSTPGILPKPTPGSDVIKKLRDFYRPYNREFEKLARMKFSWTDL